VKGTLARIDAVLRPRQNDKPQEFRTDFIAEAVERELDRRAGIQARAMPPVSLFLFSFWSFRLS
jgi:hypothetical protein